MKPSPKEDGCRRIAQVRLEVAGPRGKASFAKKLGISPSTYDYYESNRVPSAEVLVRIADIAGVDLTWLLTGTSGPQDGVAASHPAIRRAAALLDEHPDAAGPLAAFVDLLNETYRAVLGLAMDSLSAPAVPSQALSAETETAPAEASLDASGEALAVEANEPAEAAATKKWIPILGRTAAGVPQFWSEADETAGLTTLDELIARHARKAARHVQPAMLHDGAAQQAAQVITLRTAGADEVPQYVSCDAIKARYSDAFAVRIDGNSMAPDIAHGDLVILSPSAAAIDGRAAVVQLVEQIGVTCKLYRREGETVHLVPINEQYSPVSVPASQVLWALRVLGRIRQGFD